MNKFFRVFWIAILPGMFGCTTDTAPELSQTLSDLVSIPLPDYEAMEPLVREQLKTAQDSLDAALAGPNPDQARLSLMFGGLGQRYQVYGFDEAARACFLNASSLDHTESKWPYYLGHLLSKDARAQESLLQYERALTLNPDYLPAYIALSEGYIEADRLDEAEQLLNKARELDEESAPVYLGLGQVASIRNAHDQAIDYLETARRLDPEASQINYLLGMAYRAQGDQEKASYYLARRGVIRPRVKDPLLDDLQDLVTGAYAFRLRGIRAYLERRYETALEEYQNAINAAPDNPEFYTNVAVVLSAMDSTEEAIEHLEEALRLSPKRAVTLFTMGTMLAKMDQDQDAIPFYQRALDSNPDYVDALFNLANAYFRLARYPDAISHYRRVVELYPQNSTARFREALALVRTQQWESALRALETAHSVHPDDAQITDLLIRMLAACPVDQFRDGPRALSIAEGAVASDPSFRNAEVLAMALAEVGRFDEAIAIQERILAVTSAASRADLEKPLAANLARYERKQACRNPDVE